LDFRFGVFILLTKTVSFMTKKTKGWLKWVMVFVGLVIIGLAILYYTSDTPRPTGIQGAEADALAESMLKAVNDEAWQLTGAVSWTFAGKRDLIWDRKRHYTKVNWAGYEVYVDINTKRGAAFENGAQKEGAEAEELIDKAWKIWVNDAFWLNPVSKVFDPGTSRSLVGLENGKKGLLIEYSSGGATPGDAYLWELDDNNLPVNWKMWVSIIPIGGMDTSWEDWQTLETGVKISTTHVMPVMTLKISNVKTAVDLIELAGEDIFEGKW
jgi:hypothetical protein